MLEPAFKYIERPSGILYTCLQVVSQYALVLKVRFRGLRIEDHWLRTRFGSMRMGGLPPAKLTSSLVSMCGRPPAVTGRHLSTSFVTARIRGRLWKS